VAIGDEICVRLGMASYDPEIRNSIFFENGLHATSIIGTLAAAAAGATLLNLDEGGIADAIGIAASMGAGILEANRTGGSVKRIHCGWAAHAGVNAALLARHGLTGPPTVLEGRFGFFRAYSEGRFDRGAIVEGLGEEWELPRIFYKPYPTNHFTHAGIDAALALRAAGLDSARIVDIELGAPAPVLRTIAEPPEQKARPLTPYHAKFSGPFTVATALVGGGGLGVSNDDFNEDTLADPERLRLAGLVRCVADDEATEVFPHQFPAVLTVRLDDGSEMSERIRYNRGGPDRPLSPEELATKFRINAEQALAPASVNSVEAAVRGLDEAGGIGSLMDEMH
jgi:2-methylcitrate dehydratase PrpD